MKKNNRNTNNGSHKVPYGQPYQADPEWHQRRKSEQEKQSANSFSNQQGYDQQYSQEQYPAQQGYPQPSAYDSYGRPYYDGQGQMQQGYPQPSGYDNYGRPYYNGQGYGANYGQNYGQSGHYQQGYGQQYSQEQYPSQQGYPQQGYDPSQPGGSDPKIEYYQPGSKHGQPMRKQKTRETGGKMKKKRTKLLLTLAIILAIAAGLIYGFIIKPYNDKVRVKQDFIDNWADLDSDGFGPANLDDIEKNSDPIIRVKKIDKNVENILLLGVDGGDMSDGSHRSDSMMLVSINRKQKTVSISSLMRDIWVYYPNREAWDKLNAAYAYGGPGQTVNIINHNFELDIQKYIVTDFYGLENIVDILGGIDMTITDAEAGQIGDIGSGQVRLNGLQALTYARIRAIDSDFTRVQRQRNVITAMLAELKRESPATQIETINTGMDFVRSNISVVELTGDLLSLVLAGSSNMEQLTIPEEGMYTVNAGGSWYMELDWQEQIASLHNFIYRTNN